MNRSAPCHGAVAAEALAAPLYAVAEKGGQPDGGLEQVFDGDEPEA